MDSNTYNQLLTGLAVFGALLVVTVIFAAYVSKIFRSWSDITDSLTHGPLLIIGIIFVLVAGGLIAQRYKISPQVSYKHENGSYGIQFNSSEEVQGKRKNEKPVIKKGTSPIQPDSSKKEGKTQLGDLEELLKDAHKAISKFFEQPNSDK